jgi:hypothetical protein
MVFAKILEETNNKSLFHEIYYSFMTISFKMFDLIQLYHTRKVNKVAHALTTVKKPQATSLNFRQRALPPSVTYAN